jgi:alpha-L-rhamnosidase
MSTAASPSAATIVDLRTEFVVSPIGVATLRPQLSWRFEANRRGMRQTAYRIRVASSADMLADSQADLWDSGRVDSDSCTAIRYDGAPLLSRRRCYWNVCTWDESGAPCAPSETAWWEMGLLDPSDWSAKWLAAEDQNMRDDRARGLGWIKGLTPLQGPNSQFRLRFSTSHRSDVTLFVAAYGQTDIWLDGEPLVAPPMASFIVGPRPATEIAMSLPAGRHVLAVSLAAPDTRLAAFNFPSGQMAPFLRARSSDGTTLRFQTEGWKTQLSGAADWQAVEFDDAHWHEAETVTEPRHQPWPKQPAFLLRRSFEVLKPLERARIYATALGAYELQLNGARVGDALLTPESTDFRKRALYRVYDVTEQIRGGENVIGAMVGDGWFASYTVIAGRYPWGAPPRRIVVQLELTYADGTQEVIGSGLGWRTARAPIVSAEIYDGEYYDARLEQPGWSAPGFDASNWDNAEIATSPSVALTPQISPPIRREIILIARAVTEPSPGVFVFDFGQNFAGWCRLRVTGPAGQPVEMRFAELLTASGEVDQSNLRSARQTDTYVLKGDPAGECFEPHFTYHGFRYVQLTGFPGVPTADDLKGVVIHSDLQITGGLAIDNRLIEGLWHNALWSQRSNFMGIPTDCPQRDERIGWLGDANVFWDAAAFNMEVDSFTRRFMTDVCDAQADSGAFSEFSPAAYRDPPGIGSGNLTAVAGKDAKIGAAPGWADAGICLPWTVWQRYGDTGIIDENWRAMERYLCFISDSNTDFVWRHDRGADYGDWLALDAQNPGDPTTPKDLLATAVWAHSVACMAQMAEATARAEEARRYRSLWANIASAFQKNFVESDGSVGNDSQTGYILALRYNLIPPGLRPVVARRLVADIERRGTLLSTGFLGTPNSLDVLADAGYGKIVYSLLLRTEYPSWGYMVAKGATTIWERWNGDTGDVSMNSFNHYALGAVSGFLFRRIAGIAPLEPGFRRIEVRPVLDPRVESGGGEYASVLGRICTRWRQRGAGKLDLDLTVPPNATAVIHLPAAGASAVTEGNHPLACSAGVRVLGRDHESVVIEVGSGFYQFCVA